MTLATALAEVLEKEGRKSLSDQEAAVMALWETGLTYKEIASKIPSTTRSSVAGIVYRLRTDRIPKKTVRKPEFHVEKPRPLSRREKLASFLRQD